MFRGKKPIYAVVSVLITAVILTAVLVPVFTIAGNHSKAVVTEALNAIISHDENAWLNCVHPNGEPEISELDPYLERLSRKGIELTGEIEKLRMLNISHQTTNGVTTWEDRLTAKIGGKSYIIYLRYLKDNVGAGIYSFDIIPKDTL